MSLTQYASQALLNYFFGKSGNFDDPPPLFLAASTSEPASDGTNVTEPGGDGYERVELAAVDFVDATDTNPSVVDNVGVVSFPEATGSWGTITHVVLFDALTNGNPLFVAALSATRLIEDEDTLSADIGELDFTLT